MKKTLIKILSAVLLCGAFAVAAPKAEVQAYTSYSDMTYEEVCKYWSSTPLWKQLYDLEASKSDYLDNAKADLCTYFKVSLSDFVNREASVTSNRPLTANYLREVIKLSNSNLVTYVKGAQSSSSLYDVLKSEVKSCAKGISDSDAGACATELKGYLNNSGVYTVSEYDTWKKNHGCNAFEFFMGRCYKGRSYCRAWEYYRYYYGPWGWGWYLNEVKKGQAAESKAKALYNAEKKAYEAQQQAEAAAYNAIKEAYEDQQEAIQDAYEDQQEAVQDAYEAAQDAYEAQQDMIEAQWAAIQNAMK